MLMAKPYRLVTDGDPELTLDQGAQRFYRTLDQAAHAYNHSTATGRRIVVYTSMLDMRELTDEERVRARLSPRKPICGPTTV
jgi:hypothetical protein